MMQRLRDPSFVLVVLFAGLLGMVPLIQTALEAWEENGIAAFELFNEAPSAEHLRGFERNLEKASWAAKLSRPWLQYLQFAWFNEGGEKLVAGLSGWYFYKPGLSDMLARPDDKHPHAGTNDPVRAIVDFRDQLAVVGIKLLVVPVPNKESVYPDRLSARAGNARAVLAPRTKRVLEELRAARVEVVDLFAAFREARAQQSIEDPPLYLEQDTHWSPSGVRVAVKAVARRLTELGWLQEGRANYFERPVTVRRVGDIVRMLQTPMIERGIRPEAIVCEQVIRTKDGQPYNDEASAELLVLGDSFMRIYQQDEPQSAGFIAHLARELKQPMMSIINDGGGATLVREELRARPGFLTSRKVVVWEFVERDIGLGVKGWQRLKIADELRN